MSDIKIMAHPKMDPNYCDFILENPVEEFGAYVFKSSDDAKGSILAEEIFNLGGIGSVLIIGKTVTIEKATEEPWQVLGKKIGSALRAALTSNQPLINSSKKDKTADEKDLIEKVKGIFANQINPAVADHGGYIELIDVNRNDLFIRMGGGCQGCASSTATLKQGVEQTLRDHIPHLGSIIDTTDHAAGANPYL